VRPTSSSSTAPLLERPRAPSLEEVALAYNRIDRRG